MKKDAIILGVTAAVIVAGITGAVIAGKLKKQEVAEVPNDGAGEPPTTEEEQVYEEGRYCSYTGEMEISNIKITLDEINQLKVYTLDPPKDESKYIPALAQDFLEEDFERADVRIYSHESTAGPEFKGWGNRYTYKDKETGQELFDGGLYSAGSYVRRDICDNTEDLIAWINELIDRNHLGIQGEGIHMEYDSTTLRTAYTCTPYFGLVPKASDKMSGSMNPPDEQGVRYEGAPDMEFQYSGGTLTYAWMYSMTMTKETGLSKSYASFEEIYQLVYDSLTGPAEEGLYHDVVLDRMELYYNIGIKNDGTFVATPWVSFTGQEKANYGGPLLTQSATYNVNLETKRVYQGL